MPQELLPKTRCQLLNEAWQVTSSDRNEVYGDYVHSLRLAGEFFNLYRVAVLDSKLEADYGPGHEASMQALFQKIARIATGQLHADNYRDGAVYLTGAYEAEYLWLQERKVVNELERLSSEEDQQ